MKQHLGAVLLLLAALGAGCGEDAPVDKPAMKAAINATYGA